MSLRFHKYGVLLLFLGLVFATGCDDNKDSMTVTSPSPVAVTQTGVSVEPAALQPEFLPGFSCRSNRAFGTRIIVLVGGRNDVLLRGLRFRFTDRFGFNALPQVALIPGPSPMTTPPVSIPSSSPIPLPGIAPLPTAPVPIPGSTPVSALFIPAGAPRTFPFFLTFGSCPFSEGTLFVTVDAGDRNGTMQSSEMRVRVGP